MGSNTGLCRLLEVTYDVQPLLLRGVDRIYRTLMEIDAFPEGFARLPADTVVLSTLQILPGILGVHVSHDAIPLNCRVIFVLLSKEVIGEARDGALGDLGFDESNGFTRVTFPFRHLGVLVQGQTHFQNSLGCFC